MSDVRVGLAGVGYWGTRLARNIHEVRGGRLAAICDPDPERLDVALHRYPRATGTTDFEEFIASDDLDAVVLATPPSVHGEHGLAALAAGKHVMVEKPLALSSAECEALCSLARESERVLMVGHTFVYSQPVRMLRELIQSGELGKLLYVYGQRVNLGLIREDLNALWNFGPHDISILLYLLEDRPVSVTARQFALLNRTLEDVAFVIVEFAGGVVGHIHDSWLDPRKVRQLTVVGDEKMAVYDDTDVESPLRIYDSGVFSVAADSGERRRFGAFSPDDPQGFGEFKLEVRAGDTFIPRVPAREPLAVEIEHFVECVQTGAQPLTDGPHGQQVVAILEAADQSAREDGRAVAIGAQESVG
jgi:predicted dehydrogenase